ncbi:MAG: hypothetical protein P8Z78_12290 [Gammaproteobacteria bacterium]
MICFDARVGAQSLFESGGCAAAPFFLLLAQKKEGKEKGTLLTLPAAALRFSALAPASLYLLHPCSRRRSRREKNSSLCSSNTFSLHP